jgi:hypothetical protein
MESIKSDPKTEGLVRDLRGTIERLQEKVKTLEDRLSTVEGRSSLMFGPYFALPRLSTTQINDSPQHEDGNQAYNSTTHEIWVQVNGVTHKFTTTPV